MSVSGYTNACDLIKTKHQIHYIKGENSFLPIQKNYRGAVSGVHGPRNIIKNWRLQIYHMDGLWLSHYLTVDLTM